MFPFRDITSYYAYGYELLALLYDRSECRTLMRRLLAEYLECSDTEVLMLSGDDELSSAQIEQLLHALQRLGQEEPLQYILGYTHFYGDRILVAPGVLIPRPETEELVELAIARYIDQREPLRVLEIGTGSGCIPCALAKGLGERLEVNSWDISTDALNIAKTNIEIYTEKYRARLSTLEQNLFTSPQKLGEPYDLIISNPPYIHPKEASEMTRGVLNYEPNMALFTPEEAPIIFYQGIARLVTLGYLKTGGRILVEINPLYSEQTKQSMSSIIGDQLMSSHIYNDMSGKERFIEIVLK